MKKLRGPAAVAGLACAALVLTAAPSVSPAARAEPQRVAAAGAISPFGYTANVSGLKVIESGTQIRTLGQAEVLRPCTRQVGLSSSKPALDFLPLENELIKIGIITSQTRTYRKQDAYGVKGISTIGDIRLGGPSTPQLVLKGLQSVAHAWADTSARRPRFKETHDFRFGRLTIELPDNGSVPTGPLQDLLDIINEVNGQITAPVLNAIIDLLSEVGQIEIPGLGSISLGNATGSTSRNSAEARAYALRIVVQPPGTAPTVLQLGRAAARVSRPVDAGVFRTNMGALEASMLNDTLSFGGIEPRKIPCEGTKGKVRSHEVPTAGILGGIAVDLDGITYSYKGDQDGKRANGFTRTRIDRASIPAAGLVIEDIVSKVAMRSSAPGNRVKRTPTVSVGKILVGGEEKRVPAPGKSLRFDGGVIRTKLLRDSDFYGVQVIGVQVVLTDLDATIDLANTTGKVMFR